MKRLIQVFILILLISCGKSVLSIPETASVEEKTLLENANETYTADAYIQVAKYYIKEKNNTRALESYKMAFSLDSNRHSLQFDYGNFAFNNGKEQTGLRLFKKILTSKNAQLYFNQIMPYFISFDIKKLTDNGGNNAFPSFSSDGKTVYYQTDVLGNWDIKKLFIESDSSAFVLNSPANEEHATISPDNKILAYTTDQFDTRVVDDTQKWREIMSYNIVVEQKTRLTLNYCDDYYPRFNKFNNQITFVSERADVRQVTYGKRNTNIYVMDEDGSFQVPLTKGKTYDHSGVQVEKGAFTYFSSLQDSIHFNLFRKNNLKKTIEPLLLSTEFNMTSIDASENGRTTVYTSNRYGNNDLFIYNSISKQSERISFSQNEDDKASISKDGTKVVYHNNDNGLYNLYLIDLTKRTEEPTVENVLSIIDTKL